MQGLRLIAAQLLVAQVRIIKLYYPGPAFDRGAAAGRAGSYYYIILFKASPAYRRGTHDLPWGAPTRTGGQGSIMLSTGWLPSTACPLL